MSIQQTISLEATVPSSNVTVAAFPAKRVKTTATVPHATLLTDGQTLMKQLKDQMILEYDAKVAQLDTRHSVPLH